MKQGTLVTKVAMLLIFVAMIGYLIFSALRSFYQPFTTILTYPYQVDDVVEATGYLVRDEVVVYGATDIMDIEPLEGEKVARGAVLAYLYQDNQALERKQKLQALDMELEQFSYALADTGMGWDTATLDRAIADAAIGLKVDVARGDLTGLEEQSLILASTVIRREYTYGDSDQGEIEALMVQTQGEIDALQATASRDTALIRAEQSGLFSALTDGYETRLTPQTIEGLTPDSYNNLVSKGAQAPDGAVGKLIVDDTWEFVTTLSQEDAQRLYQGATITVRFSRDWSGQVPMQVTRLSDAQNGKVAVVLTSDRFLGDVTLLRKQTVELVFDSVVGIRVPKKALRSVVETTVDPDTGVEGTTQRTGVYTVAGIQAEFKETIILADDGDHYLLAPMDESDRTALRAGDEVIVAAVDLYNGKIID